MMKTVFIFFIKFINMYIVDCMAREIKEVKSSSSYFTDLEIGRGRHRSTQKFKAPKVTVKLDIIAKGSLS